MKKKNDVTLDLNDMLDLNFNIAMKQLFGVRNVIFIIIRKKIKNIE